MSARRPTGPRDPGANRPTGATTRPRGSAGRAGGAARAGRSSAAGPSTARPASARGASARPAAAPSTSPRPAVDREDPGHDAPGPTITLRGVGLFIVLLVAFVVLAPTLRHAVEQQEQLRQLSADIETELERNAALERELEQWQDPTFVQAQARDRLGYVMPGEQTYRVVDPEVVVGDEAEAEAEQETTGGPGSFDAPWYISVWESVTMAGQASDGEMPDGPAGPGAPAG